MSSDNDGSGFVEIDDGETTWRFEREFLTSNWTCLFGNGCKGILAEETETLHQGCCSLGAHFGDGEPGQAEARQLSAYVALLEPEQWQYHGIDDVYGDEQRTHTRVVDGACVFLNRPGFAGGVGCALHIAALASGESPTEWKPSVCWQLPLRVDWALVDESDPDGPETATVRRWGRTDWGAHGTKMAWCCTERGEGAEAYVGETTVVDSLSDELSVLAGEAVYVELRRRLRDPGDTGPVCTHDCGLPSLDCAGPIMDRSPHGPPCSGPEDRTNVRCRAAPRTQHGAGRLGVPPRAQPVQRPTADRRPPGAQRPA